MAGLELLRLTKRFANAYALHEVTLQITADEFVALVGPSGCGKTTLLRTVAGLETLDEGEVVCEGRRLNSLPPRDRDIGMVFQGESLYPHLTAFENIAFPLRMRRVSGSQIRDAVVQTARRVGVADLLERMPNTLSGGERQRVAIGRALIRNPKVLLLDEPFAHLDLPLRRQLARELLVLREDWNATTIFVTHDHEEAARLADRVAVMHAGKIQQFDQSDRIRAKPANEFVAGFFDSSRA